VHGNFIVNDGGATAAEMLELIEKIKTVARVQRGIELENGSSNCGRARHEKG
jgi:UDP-N-acetylenolpyruvoylglucosamine reductase